MAEYRSLLEELAQNITAEDLEQLKSACKEDIPSEESEAIATSHHWFAFLEKHSKLDKGETPPGVTLAPWPHPCPSPGPQPWPLPCSRSVPWSGPHPGRPSPFLVPILVL